MNNLPGNLRVLRKSKKLQQEDMMEPLGISRATWSNYELGKTEPQIQTLLDIAGFFEVSMDDLLKNNLSEHPQWAQKKPVRYQQQKRKKGLQLEENIAKDANFATGQEELLQQILEELRAIRKNISQQ